jgi:hypothetical protein
VPLEVAPNARNLSYLRTKKEKLGHALEIAMRGAIPLDPAAVPSVATPSACACGAPGVEPEVGLL